MSGLLFLTADDFSVIKNDDPNKNDIMINNVDNFSLILFYSTHCQHCQNIIPIMKKLPGTVTGCQFGMINVSVNKKCVQMSRNTIAPIKYVPYIVLYVNGRPFMKYQGPYDINEIQKFVVAVSQKIQTKQKFDDDENVKENVRGGIPEYTIGHPLCGKDKVCYLDFDDAYDK